MDSGGPLQVPKVSDGQKDYDSIVDSVRCTHRQDTLACLRTVPFDTLAAAINETRDIFSFSSLNLAWIPRIDGDLIKEEPYTLIRRISALMDDARILGLYWLQSLSYLPFATAEQLQRIADVYPDEPSQGSPFDTGAASALTSSGSPPFNVICSSKAHDDFYSRQLQRLRTPGATVRLNKQGKTSSILGASHASDSSEWFGSHSAMETFAVDAMINFINTFDPNVTANALAPNSSLFWPQWQEPTGVPLLVFIQVVNQQRYLPCLRARAQSRGVSTIFARGTMIDHIMSLLSTSTSVWVADIHWAHPIKSLLCKAAASLFGPLPTSSFDTTSEPQDFILLREIPRLKMDSLERLIHSPSYKQSNFAFSSSDGMSTLLKFTENAVSNSPGNNDGVENIGDAYTNMAVLIVIKDYLDSIQDEKQYSADESYARAIFLHSRLISNNILGRIHYKSGYDDPKKLRIDSATRVALLDWIAANHEHAPPKALADLFEANAWLIVQVYQFPALCSHLKALLFPLLPTALSMYEATPYGAQRQCPSDYFISQIQYWRKRDARKVDEEHVKLLITELTNIASNRPFCAAVDHLRSALEQGPFIRFDSSGNIEGTHQRLQLLGYNLLRYYIAVDIDRSLPLTRSVVKGAAKFQSILANLAASDQCLEYLVRTFGLDAICTDRSLLPRSAAEIFVAAIAMVYEEDKVPGTPELLPSAMWCIAGQLVRRASLALSKAADNKIIPVPSVPSNPLDINTFPRELELPHVEVYPAGKEAQAQVQTFLQMPSLDPYEIYLPSILEVAVKSAVLSIRQRGDLQYLALVNYITHALGKPRHMYHGTDMASLAMIGHLPGTLGYGLTIYKRGVVKAYECVDTSSGSAALFRNVCDAMATSTVLGELGGRFGSAISTLLSRDLLATMDSGDRHTAEGRWSSDTSLMHFLLNTLEPIVISVCGQIKQVRRALIAPQIATSPSRPIVSSTDKNTLQEHIPILSLLSAPEAVTSFTLYHIPRLPITAPPPTTKPLKASSTRSVFPITQAEARVLASLKLKAVLGKRKRSDEDEGISVPKAFVVTDNVEAATMKENIDPASISGAR
ncbi:hypothetical protein EYR38_010698 [Pleurotus pulmonarius]|nr:hypothetical protein EYR38_010698 [Pleurotus pulmonarius]